MADAETFLLLQEMTRGYFLPRCLHVVADMGVADALDETSRTAAELAAVVGAHADSLDRVLRLLASNGVFVADGTAFRHNDASRLLRSDHPQSIRAFVRLEGLKSTWETYEYLEHTVRTGRPAVEKSAPEGRWAHFAAHPEESSIFNGAMAAKGKAALPGILAAYDFSSFGVIADIAGGLGHLLTAILAQTPNVKGVLFELPAVAAKAQGIASDRLTVQGGDFFAGGLPAADAYLLMEVIHDWGDEQALAILKSVRQAATAGAKLLLIETIIPDDPGPHWSRVLDIHMMALFGGGRQRTRKQYEALFDQTGFTFTREIPAGAFVSIIEAVPV